MHAPTFFTARRGGSLGTRLTVYIMAANSLVVTDGVPVVRGVVPVRGRVVPPRPVATVFNHGVELVATMLRLRLP